MGVILALPLGLDAFLRLSSHHPDRSWHVTSTDLWSTIMKLAPYCLNESLDEDHAPTLPEFAW